MYQYIRSLFSPLEILLLGPSVSLLHSGPVIPYYYMVVNIILSQNSLCSFHVFYLLPGSKTPFFEEVHPLRGPFEVNVLSVRCLDSTSIVDIWAGNRILG